ncbi:MAG: hydantoinase/oxoprolinase family protein [Actinomycetota bacterium]|nr:hydantoinase/oxoprolinase family protein [Actinomycetota bacterium]
MNGYRVGVDVGGTFTDLICVTPAGEVLLDKTPTTLEDQSVGVMNGLAQLAEHLELSLGDLCGQLDVLVHGTTTADNTMIEMDGAAVGLLVTEGHRDEIELRRVHKEEIWDPSYPAPPPIARRRARIAIPERVDHTGEVVLPLDEEAVRAGIRRLRQLGARSLAVLFLFSYVNPDHERRAAELIAEEYPDVEHVSLSHEVMAGGPEFERTSTTLVNAYVAPRISAYVSRLTERLRSAGHAGSMLIMQSTGGVMPPDYVARRAVSLLGSGPTGGVMGAAVAAERAGEADFVAVDMGGTSFDICLVRGGRPEVKTDRNWRYRYYIGLPMVDVRSVGAGGGSVARVRQGALLVGPESAGSVPGPACYGRGGARATVTDADAVLGYLPASSFAGGRMTLDAEASRAAIDADVAGPLGLDGVEAAWAIERIVNANMANATRRVLASYGADPRDLALIAYGGNGPVHAWALAAELGITRVVVPKAAPAFSALGLLVADHLIDLVRSYVVPISQVDLGRLRSLMATLADTTAKELAPAGLAPGAVVSELFVQMAYSGQNSDVSVPVPEGTSLDDTGLLDLAARFHDLHEADRGFAFRQQQPVIRGVRLVTRGHTPKPERLAEALGDGDAGTARTGRRPVYFGDGWLDTAVYDGTLLGTGAEVEGPALIEEPFTVVVVPPGSSARLAEHASYELRPVPD